MIDEVKRIVAVTTREMTRFGEALTESCGECPDDPEAISNRLRKLEGLLATQQSLLVTFATLRSRINNERLTASVFEAAGFKKQVFLPQLENYLDCLKQVGFGLGERARILRELLWFHTRDRGLATGLEGHHGGGGHR